MKLNIKELLDFFDDKKDSEKEDANALMTILGEELNASAYKHFRNNEVEILNDPVGPGTLEGKRLDRWILDKKNKKLYQCEIKNYAATAVVGGGYQLKSNDIDEEIKKVATRLWEHELEINFANEKKHPNGHTKVLLKMRRPKKYINISKTEPLLIYWMPIFSDRKGLKTLSFLNIKELGLKLKTEFDKLQIFSVSLYLRQLYKNGKGKKFINLEMPHFEHRMQILNKLRNKE